MFNVLHYLLPSNDTAVHPGMLFDSRPFEYCAPLDADPLLHHHPRPQGDVRPDHTVVPHPGGGVHYHIAHEAGALGQQAAVLLSEAGEVEAHAGQEVCRLTHVHPEARQLHAVQLPVLGLGRKGEGRVNYYPKKYLKADGWYCAILKTRPKKFENVIKRTSICFLSDKLGSDADIR